MMKPTNHASSLSPPSTAPPSGVTKSTAHLPISRSNNPSWDKPERARTSHACEPCRERKTKCDGERPSCRRCSHTGTSCHYGYGKGWRKRKTAEDLTATSRRLARYENLLAEILPMVSSEVRALIEEARDQDAATSNGSETNETDHSYTPGPLLKHETSSISSSSSRILLPLPVPSPLAPSTSRLPTASGTYDTVGPTPGVTGPNATPGIAATQPRLSPEGPMVTRLPSITPDGQLIDTGMQERSPPRLQHSSDSKPDQGSDRLGGLPTSPHSQVSSGGHTRLRTSPG